MQKRLLFKRDYVCKIPWGGGRTGGGTGSFLAGSLTVWSTLFSVCTEVWLLNLGFVKRLFKFGGWRLLFIILVVWIISRVVWSAVNIGRWFVIILNNSRFSGYALKHTVLYLCLHFLLPLVILLSGFLLLFLFRHLYWSKVRTDQTEWYRFFRKHKIVNNLKRVTIKQVIIHLSKLLKFIFRKRHYVTF